MLDHPIVTDHVVPVVKAVFDLERWNSDLGDLGFLPEYGPYSGLVAVFNGGLVQMPFNFIWYIFNTIVWVVAFIPEGIYWVIWFPMYAIALGTNIIMYWPGYAWHAFKQVTLFMMGPFSYWNNYPDRIISM